MIIDVYDYIAANNSRDCARIIESFDYRIERKNDMAQNLRDLVNLEGKEALTEIMKYHPDKNYFEDINLSKKSKSKDRYELDKFAYLNATGQNSVNQQLKSDNSANQTNTVILAASIILAIAILSKK